MMQGQEQAATRDAYGVTNQQRMAAYQESSWANWNIEGPAGFYIWKSNLFNQKLINVATKDS